MSTSISDQLDAITTKLQTDFDAIRAQVQTLQSELTPGSTVTQAQIDRLTALDASVAALVVPPVQPPADGSQPAQPADGTASGA